MDKFEVKLDQAARAAWMSYVGGMIALARQEGLVKVHIDHPISTCMALGSALRERARTIWPWRGPSALRGWWSAASR